MRPKSALVRLVRRRDGRVEPDFAKRAPGRGAYVCPLAACVEATLKRGRLAHAFGGPAEAAPDLLVWAGQLKAIESSGQQGR